MIRFQAAHGLWVDGIAGPQTFAAMSRPFHYPGAGYAGRGSGAVRVLQRRLDAAGYAPGPIDGRYGPRTEQAVIRFQAAHGLRVDGIAGPQTFAGLERVRDSQRRASRPKPSSRVKPSPPSALHRGASGVEAPRSRGRASRPAGSSSKGLPALLLALVGPAALLVLLAVVGPEALAGGRWLLQRRRGERVIVTPTAPSAEQTRAAEHEVAEAPAEVGREMAGLKPARAPGSEPDSDLGRSDLSGEVSQDSAAAPAIEFTALLGREGDLAAIEEEYRRADERGDPVAASNLGVLLERRGDLAGAEKAYRRADERGDINGAFNLGRLLAERGISPQLQPPSAAPTPKPFDLRLLKKHGETDRRSSPASDHTLPRVRNPDAQPRLAALGSASPSRRGRISGNAACSPAQTPIFLPVLGGCKPGGGGRLTASLPPVPLECLWPAAGSTEAKWPRRPRTPRQACSARGRRCLRNGSRGGMGLAAPQEPDRRIRGRPTRWD